MPSCFLKTGLWANFSGFGQNDKIVKTGKNGKNDQKQGILGILGVFSDFQKMGKMTKTSDFAKNGPFCKIGHF